VKAFGESRRYNGIIARSNGSVSKADLDRVLRRRKPRGVMRALSLANVSRRHPTG
jgi:hypothetical protein